MLNKNRLEYLDKCIIIKLTLLNTMTKLIYIKNLENFIGYLTTYTIHLH